MNSEMLEKMLHRAMKREGLDCCEFKLYLDALDNDERNTYCRVSISGPGLGYWIGVGFSRCNPKDKFNREIGEAIAMSRAARAAAAKVKQELERET